MKWSTQQDGARRAVARWMRDPRAAQTLYLAGYAGSGKTTVAKALVADSNARWLFAAYTGKAAHVLRQKGCDNARTIHSLIYQPQGEQRTAEIARLEAVLVDPLASRAIRDEAIAQLAALRRANGLRFSRWDTGPLAQPSVEGVVIDEVSMVDEAIGRDLESFGKKILVIGDPAQLPPVRGGGYFTAREPDVMLTEIHRQARESGVLRLATHIRGGGSLHDFTAAGADVAIAPRRTARARAALEVDQVLVGRNRTRHQLNQRHRALEKRDGELPVAGDRLVCLRNDREAGVFNGSQWIVDDADCDPDSQTGRLALRSEEGDGRTFDGEAWLHHFLGRADELEAMGQRQRQYPVFDWGYALTVHKAQGSGWDRVLVVDESDLPGTDPRRWLYTAVTRAAKEVTVLT